LAESVDFTTTKNLSGDDNIDWSNVKDLYDEDELFEDMKKQGFETDQPKAADTEKVKKQRQLRQKQIAALEEQKFT
jgi:hypothetical protein